MPESFDVFLCHCPRARKIATLNRLRRCTRLAEEPAPLRMGWHHSDPERTGGGAEDVAKATDLIMACGTAPIPESFDVFLSHNSKDETAGLNEHCYFQFEEGEVPYKGKRRYKRRNLIYYGAAACYAFGAVLLPPSASRTPSFRQPP